MDVSVVDLIVEQDAQAPIWEDARRLWLERQRSANTREAYQESLDHLLGFCGVQLWQVRRTDIARWTNHLRRTVSEATLALRLSAVSSFYRFASEDYTITAADGAEIPLCQHNPVLGAARPKISPYNKAAVMDAAAARAFLAAIPRTETPVGRRDYALFLGYLMTGRRNSEWRTIRYEDIEFRPSGMVFRWSGKGRRGVIQDLAEPVWVAISEYAAIEGRESGYVFHSYDWHGNVLEQPVGAVTVRTALKYYAQKAGLNPDRLRVHSLRHTAALLRREAGDDMETIRDFLGHSNLSTTQVYLHTLQGRRDDTWQTVADMLGLKKSS